MLGFFTDPDRDELLYSACARYHRRASNPSKHATARDLFGKAQTKITVDFQTRLGYLASQLPPETYSVSRLIDEHTMLPLYAPFMRPGRHEEIRRDMGGEGGGSVHARLGILTSGITVGRLRFCPACAEEDRGRTPGEPYWHRVHQVPGIEACPVHAIFLVDSAVNVRKRNNDQALVTARQSINELPPAATVAAPLDLENREHQIILRLARGAGWILDARIQVSDLDALRDRYLRMLSERGLVWHGGVRHARLHEQFLDYYPPGFLNRLGCGLELRYHWLRRLLNDWKRSRHPLHHLLLMEFLGRPVEEFFNGPVEIEPFGKGPWPCLNRAGGHYMELRITDYHASVQKARKGLVGTFHCDCGFSYRRAGPDSTGERRYQYDAISSFGEAWYGRLRGLRAEGKKDRQELAQTLGVTVSVIALEVKRLNKADALGQFQPRGESRRGRAPKLSDTELREKHRGRWDKVVAENPDLGRSSLGIIEKNAYIWLLKHDREWMEANSPTPLRSLGQAQRRDWAARDEKYAADVRKAAEQLLSTPSRPVRASRTGIAAQLRILAAVYKHSSKLPLTNKALEEVSESAASFASRRVRWAADCCRQERLSANPWKLQARAAVSNKMARVPEVKAALEECAQSLLEMNQRGWEGLSVELY